MLQSQPSLHMSQPVLACTAWQVTMYASIWFTRLPYGACIDDSTFCGLLERSQESRTGSTESSIANLSLIKMVNETITSMNPCDFGVTGQGDMPDVDKAGLERIVYY
jgi:hypothetical protein